MPAPIVPAPTMPAPAPAVTRTPIGRPRGLLAPLSPAAYACGHAAFEARSTQRAVIADWLGERLARRPGPLSLLSVGCGDGRLDAQLARRLATPGAEPVRYDGLDPHAPSAARFLLELAQVPGAVPTATVAGVEQLDRRAQHDVVLAVHSLYYVGDLAGTVARLRRAVRPGGELVVLLASTTGLNALASTLAPPTGGHRQWWSEDLGQALDDLDLPASRTSLRGVLDLDDCLDAADETGRHVLDFTVQGHVPAALRLPVLDELVALRRPGRGLRLDHPVDAWVVPAP